jgi:hypothetical protein
MAKIKQQIYPLLGTLLFASLVMTLGTEAATYLRIYTARYLT